MSLTQTSPAETNNYRGDGWYLTFCINGTHHSSELGGSVDRREYVDKCRIKRFKGSKSEIS